jgi:hypothetical protein
MFFTNSMVKILHLKPRVEELSQSIELQRGNVIELSDIYLELQSLLMELKKLKRLSEKEIDARASIYDACLRKALRKSAFWTSDRYRDEQIKIANLQVKYETVLEKVCADLEHLICSSLDNISQN